MPQAKSHTSARIRAVLILALTVGLLWYFFRNVQFGEVWRHMQRWWRRS
jgi:hypothetical protein